MVPVAEARAKPLPGQPELVPNGTLIPNQGTIAGPRVEVAAPILDQYFVGFVSTPPRSIS